MADADILAVTKQGKGMPKRQLLRLLIAESESTEEITLALEGVDGLDYVTMTKSEAIDYYRQKIDEEPRTKADSRTESIARDILEDRIPDIRDIWDDEPGDRTNR